ncbi:hypothetical protein Trydic_g14674 [Trypoxylus dichotomus]
MRNTKETLIKTGGEDNGRRGGGQNETCTFSHPALNVSYTRRYVTSTTGVRCKIISYGSPTVHLQYADKVRIWVSFNRERNGDGIRGKFADY